VPARPIEEVPWVSVSDLAEYAFCPRAHWYRGHPTGAAPEPAADRRAEAGTAYHRRELSRVRARESRGAGWAIAAAAIGILLLAAILLGWIP